MYRVVIECETLNCDNMIVQMIETVKSMQKGGLLGKLPGGLKIPSFFNADMFKSLPQEQKLNMLAMGLNQEKSKMIPMVQGLLNSFIGEVELSDVNLQTNVSDDCEAVLRLDITRIDTEKAIDILVEKVLKEEDLPEILGEHFDENLTMENIAFYMHGQSQETQNYLALKTMSVEKNTLMSGLQEYAASKDINVIIKNIKFMMQDS